MPYSFQRVFVESAGLFMPGEAIDNEQMDAYIAHQTSSVHIRGLCDSLGLPSERFPLTLAEHGNTASASVPFTLAKHQEQLSSGDRVLLMGIGSGLNTSFAELAW